MDPSPTQRFYTKQLTRPYVKPPSWKVPPERALQSPASRKRESSHCRFTSTELLETRLRLINQSPSHHGSVEAKGYPRPTNRRFVPTLTRAVAAPTPRFASREPIQGLPPE